MNAPPARFPSPSAASSLTSHYPNPSPPSLTSHYPNPPPPPPPSLPSSLTSHYPNRPPPPPPPLPPPPPSLTAALSTLTSLLDLSTTTLHSLPLSTSSSSAATALLPCPFNPNHRLPPSSLFSHYLNCPSPVSLPHTPQYTETLHLENTDSISFPSSISTSSDLCVSLEKYVGYNASTNFFYQNCPGPVTILNRPPLLLTLPGVLYLECSDFNQDTFAEKHTRFPVSFVGFFPSEIWAIQNETEAWGAGIPTLYSVRILRAILKLRDCKLVSLLKWVVASSPKYGLIIDFAMRDHFVLLVRLCLKAIITEAFGLADFIFNNKGKETEENAFVGLSNRNFECPILEKVLMWLSLQFAVLYGEVNGKLFAAALLKECIMESAFNASLFPLDERSSESGCSEEVDVEAKEPVERGHTVGDSVISVSQVAAAVAALLERSIIEEKIRALRDSRWSSTYQRNLEHEYISKAAGEERQKRSDYRPIIEHDGLLWQRSRDQEANKVKTREELLAEERDYKRRRMSYRGKKLKRNTVEVLRDIIEEYMDEIRQAGGIDGKSNAVDGAEASASHSLHIPESASDVSVSRRNHNASGREKGQLYSHRKELLVHHHSEDSKDDTSPRKLYPSVERRSGERHDYVDYFGDSSSQWSEQSGSRSRDQNHDKRDREKHESSSHRRERDEYKRNSYERKRNEDNRKHREIGRRRTKRDRGESDEEDAEHRYKHKSKINSTSSSFPAIDREFDRYDPAESHDFYEDDR